ncbi:MAG: energy transducer TonB [Bacteroidetes bacterium]|nr:MAG: energy transducer TonB [Bacteroidota bacterium]
MAFLNTRHEKKSFTLTTALLSALLLLLFYIGLTYMDPPIENGITVNFGTTDFGSGQVQPKEKIQSQPNNTPVEPTPQEEKVEEVQEVQEEVIEEEVVSNEPTEKVLTQESEESILIKQQQEAKRKADNAAKKAKAEADRKAKEKRDAEQKLKNEQEAKKNKLDALMGGLNKSDGTASGSEGDDNAKAGDKGQQDGDPYAASYYGSPGAGNGTGGYGLGGRSLVNKGKVRQECNQEGIVVVKIVVDRNGKVISATPGVRGTTNNSACLLEPARKTAFLHKWNFDSKAPNEQVGFVKVNFKLGE